MPFYLPPEEDEDLLKTQMSSQAKQPQPEPEPQPEPDPEETTEDPRSQIKDSNVNLIIPDEQLSGIPKFIEENITIPLSDMLDPERDAEQVAQDREQERLTKRERLLEIDKVQQERTTFQSESERAIRGGIEDLAEGIVNLPIDVANFGLKETFALDNNPIPNVDFNFIRDNNTTAGDAVRTLVRYLGAARLGGKLTGGKLTAGKSGGSLIGGRAAQGFVEDFIGADGTAEDDTIIGSTPWTSYLQTSDRNNPIVNRTLVGFEGALFEATLLGPAQDILKTVGVGKKTANVIERLNEWTAFKQTSKTTNKQAAAYEKFIQLADKSYYGELATGSLNTKQINEALINLDQTNELNAIIDKAAGRDNEVRKYLILKLRGLNAANTIDEIHDTVKYGGPPEEIVMDGFDHQGTNGVLKSLELDLKNLRTRSAALDEEVSTFSNELTKQSSLSGTRAKDIRDLQERSLSAPRLADVEAKNLNIPVNLSAGQVRYIQDLRKLKGADGKLSVKFPKGVTITPGRRVKGLTSNNIDEYLEVLNAGPDSAIRDRIVARLQNVERPAALDDSIDTIEGLNTKVKDLQAEEAAASSQAAQTRSFLEPSLREQVEVKAQLRQLELQREAYLAKMSGDDEVFKVKAQQLIDSPTPDLPAEVVEQTLKKAEEALPTITRKAAMEAGRTADSLIPVKARAPLSDVVEPNYVGTANPIKSQLTEADIYSMSNSENSLIELKKRQERTAKRLGATDADVALRANSEEINRAYNEIVDQDLDYIEYLRENPLYGSIVNGEALLSLEGRALFLRAFNQVQKEIQELSQVAVNQSKDGAAELSSTLFRLVERAELRYKLLKDDSAIKGDMLNNIGQVARESSPLPKGPKSPSFQALIDHEAQYRAKQDVALRALQGMGKEIQLNPKSAARKMSRIIGALSFQEPTPKNQRRVWQTLWSANLKNLDGGYIQSLLSGPITQAKNFWGGFYQSSGQPLMVAARSYFPGGENKLVRAQAVASVAATVDTYKEINGLMSRLYSNSAVGFDINNPNYLIWDEDLTRNMEEIHQKAFRGELSAAEEVAYRTAVAGHKLVSSPKMQYMMKIMGSQDSFFKVIAGRQIAAQRAVEDAFMELGETRPFSAKSKAEFAEMVAARKEVHLLEIFEEDGLTLLDDEAKELADLFTFQKTVGDTDIITKKINEFAAFPGARMLGLTFIKTPSEILKASGHFTPGVSSILKKLDEKYKTGTPYYRAMRDGQEGASVFLGVLAFSGGVTGHITGAGPLNYQDNLTWQEAGNKPFTIKIPGTEIEFNYSALEPISTPVGLIADLAAMSPIGGKKLHANPLNLLMSNVVNKSYLKQISTIAQMISMNDNDLKKLGAGIAGNFFYSGLRRQLGAIVDPKRRETRAYVDANIKDYFLKSAGLGFGLALPERLDAFGKPLTRNGMEGAAGILTNIVNSVVPFGNQIGVQQGDKTFEALYKYGVNITDPRHLKGPTGANINLDNDSINEFIKLRSQDGNFKKSIDAYLFGDEFKEQFEYDKQQTEAMMAIPGADRKNTPVYKELQKRISYYNGIARKMMLSSGGAGSANFRKRYEDAVDKVNLIY